MTLFSKLEKTDGAAVVISYEELLHHSLGKIMKTHLSKTGVKAEI
jgi:hypothetical protein